MSSSRSPRMSRWFKERELKTGPYTMPELTRVRQLAEGGLSARQIGLIVKRSRKSILGACRYHKIKLNGPMGRPSWREEPLTSTQSTRLWRARQREAKQLEELKAKNGVKNDRENAAD
jgi:hypothetical protein